MSTHETDPRTEVEAHWGGDPERLIAAWEQDRAALKNRADELAVDLDHAERDNRRLTAAIARIRELHRPESDQYHGKCVECAEWWPCPTIRDLEQ